MAIDPRRGPAGTVISVRSITPSPLHGDQTALVALVTPDEEDVINLVALAVNEDGSWAGSLPVPRGTAAGDYLVEAIVSTEDPQESGGEVGALQVATAFPYVPQSFVVTSSPTRPTQPRPRVQPPVVTTPSVTG